MADLKLTENERRLALLSTSEGSEARKWMNLVLEAYDACEAERAEFMGDPVIVGAEE